MSKDIAEYIRSCDRCQRNKPTLSKSIGMLQPLEVPSRNWEHVTMDFIMDLPKSKAGHDAILVVVDKLSKAMTLIPTNSTVSAQQVAQLFLKTCIDFTDYLARYSPTETLDLRESSGKSYTALCKRNWLCHRHFIRKQTVNLNELTEHYRNLRHYVSYTQDDWCEKLA
jgi:hypothetical protein